MDHLWSPWRFRYVSKADQSSSCVFCAKIAEEDDRANLILFRAEHCFVILNLFPYTTGHLMVIPYAHVNRLEDATDEAMDEMMRLVREASRHLQTVYKPRGFNIGMNLGDCAGAGIAEHIHMHVLPRWPGDVNFITAVGETRVMPEALETTYERLHQAFHGV
jgi:ATP adenylyltransferase